ncbi:metallophosphatase domain-containing protein [Marinospirillum sp.]|uniref:metallophosphatase domain-containing protein n=1 Tax=Marinospirillum sp. TaxID=2183934 RepID=UPI003A8C4774
MRLVLISDTHGRHTELQLPAGDCLIHAGDFSSGRSWQELQDFIDWFASQPHPHKLLVAGNHDLQFEQEPCAARARLPSNIVYLQDSSMELEGIRIYGSPWTPRFFDYAFMCPRGEAMAERWARIPERTQLLITHGPAQGIADLTSTGQQVGCEALIERLHQLPDLRLHVFGHIHEDYGIYPATSTRGWQSANASSCRWGDPGLNEPLVIDWSDAPFLCG